MKKEERERLQRQRLEEMKKFETEICGEEAACIAGVDEAGRGPLAGPVVAAAVVLPRDFDVPGIDDSKKLTEKKREALYPQILDAAVSYKIVMVGPEEIDRLNILQATMMGMRQAVEGLCPAPALAFIGYQNSGKTTLVEKVINILTARGLRVGSIKHHGHAGFDIDVPGKDSWRHAQAGSRHVGLVSADRYAEYADTSEEFPLERMLERYTDVDVVIVEGYKTAGLPNFVVARSGVDRRHRASSVDLVDDIGCMLIKAIIFSIACVWIALFNGYDCKPTSEGISNATTATVVQSSLAILGLDFVLTALMF